LQFQRRSIHHRRRSGSCGEEERLLLVLQLLHVGVEQRHRRAEGLRGQRVELEAEWLGRESQWQCSGDVGELAIELLKRRLIIGGSSRRSSAGLKQCVAAPSEFLGCIE
jgi:hypothetical protein